MEREETCERFRCDREGCGFTSKSQSGVYIHHGLVHKKVYSGEDVSIKRKKLDGDELFHVDVSQFETDASDDEYFDFDHSSSVFFDEAEVALSVSITDDLQTRKTNLFNYLNSRMTSDEIDFCLLCTTNGFSYGDAAEILKWKGSCDDHNQYASYRGLRTLYKILDGSALSFFKKNSFRTLNLKIPRPGIKTSLIFAYESPSSLLMEMLMDPELTRSNSFDLEYEECYTKEGYQMFGAFNSSNWWQFAEHKARSLYGSDVFILPFILFSDKTEVDNKRSVWPIYITLGNYNIRTRNKISAKQLVGFIPKVNNRHVKDMKDVTSFTNSVFSYCYKHVFDDIKSFASEYDTHPVFELKLPFEKCERKFMFVPMMLPSDHEERVKHACIRGGQTNRPCPNCLVTRSMLTDKVYNANVKERNIHEMIEILIRNNAEEVKMYSLKNKFPASWEWIQDFHKLGYYFCLPACFIHVVQAVTKYLICFTVDAITYFRIKERPKPAKKGSNVEVDDEIELEDVENINLEKPKLTKSQRLSEMENRLANFPRFTSKGKSFKVFRIDLENGGTKLTCTERVELLFQIKYVLSTDVGTLLPESLHWKVFEVLSLWEDVLKMTWRKPGDTSYIMDDIELLFKCIVKFKKKFSSTFTANYQKIDRKILFHALDHFPIFIILYGHPKNWSTGSFEHWHTKTKKVYLRTQRQYWDCAAQMIRYMRRLRIITHYKAEEERRGIKFKPSTIVKINQSEVKFGKDETSLHDDVPLNRLYSLLQSSIETFRLDVPKEKDVIPRNFKRHYISSVMLGNIGKVYATRSYGKYKKPLYSNVFLDLSRIDNVQNATLYNPESVDDLDNSNHYKLFI